MAVYSLFKNIVHMTTLFTPFHSKIGCSSISLLELSVESIIVVQIKVSTTCSLWDSAEEILFYEEINKNRGIYGETSSRSWKVDIG